MQAQGRRGVTDVVTLHEPRRRFVGWVATVVVRRCPLGRHGCVLVRAGACVRLAVHMATRLAARRMWFAKNSRFSKTRPPSPVRSTTEPEGDCECE